MNGSTQASPPPLTGSERHRRDIQGMRAVAVILVLAYHAEVPGFGGGFIGVDVFLVLSGFLITGLILREVERTGMFNLSRFYARRIRRLLPASTVALAGSAVISFIAISQIQWQRIAGDITASGLYVVNWRFASQSVDYLASEEAASPVLHFWSLSVEEQFYFVWPILLLLAAVVAARWALRSRRVIALALAAICIPSLIWSVAYTPGSPGQAYLVTTTRIWELGAGAALAVAAPALAKTSGRFASVLAVIGAAMVIVASTSFGDGTLFPGYAALLPVVGACLVVTAGIGAGPHVLTPVLAWRPMVVIGGMSYSLYLWHWPFLVGANSWFGPFGPEVGFLILLVSAVPAYLSYRFIESPVRQLRGLVEPPRAGLSFGVMMTAASVTAGAVLFVAIPNVEAVPDFDVPQVDLKAPIGIVDSAASISPDPLNARDDLPDIYHDGCHQGQKSSEVLSCIYGSGEGPTVAIVGDSHAAQWVPTLQRISSESGFTLITFTKSQCQFAVIDQMFGDPSVRYTNCYEWRQKVLDILTGPEGPDLVLTSGEVRPPIVGPGGEALGRAAQEELFVKGLVLAWTQIVDAGVQVSVIIDTPRPGFDVPECVDRNRSELTTCAFGRAEAMEGRDIQQTAADSVDVQVVDMTDRICAEVACPAVIGGILVWRDSNHLTATFAAALADALRERITWPALP